MIANQIFNHTQQPLTTAMEQDPRKHNMDMILLLSDQICVRQNKLILLSFYDIQSFEWKYRFGFGMKLLIHPQTSTDASLKFGNGYVISLRMMTSSNGNIFRVTGPLCGKFTGPGEFPTQRPVTRSFDVFFICVWIKSWVNNREAGDLRRHRGHYGINVMAKVV